MKTLKQNWKAIVAFFLVVAAVCVYFLGYRPAKQEFESKEKELNIMITALQNTIAENLRYVDVQDKLEGANEELKNSRLELYQKFPTELKEEDQIMYVVYLEDTFRTEIQFSFGTVQPLLPLSDGSTLCGLTLTVNYRTNYKGFKNMVNYLASDERITSIQTATMEYDDEKDQAVGTLTLLCYVMDSDLLEYTQPDVTIPSTGKSNIFG